MKKSVCANCHFLCRQYHGHAGTEYTFEVTSVQRAKALVGDMSWQKPSESLGCFKGIWDEGLGFGTNDKVTCIAKQSRRGKCYFYAFQTGMFMQAAEKLQQEQVAKSNDYEKYRLTAYGVLLAIIVAVTKVVYDKW